MIAAARIRDLLTRIFGFRGRAWAAVGPGRPVRPVVTTEAGPRAGPEDGSTGAKSHEDFLEGLRRLVAADGVTLTGRVQLIGLSKFRDFFGDDWPRIKDKAERIASAAIRQRLAKEDLYTRYGEEGYLIVFAALPLEEAQLKCALIAAEISRRLIGENPALDAVEVKTATGFVGREIAFQDIRTSELMERLVHRQNTTPFARQAPPRRRTIAFDPAPSDPLVELGVKYVYRPMWFVGRNVISSYFCLPVRQDEGGRLSYGDSVLPPHLRSELIAKLDLATLDRVVCNIEILAARGCTLVLGMPLHFETLANQSARMAFIEACRTIPASYRRLLVLELVGAPPEIAQSRLLEVTSLVKPFCRAVLLRLPIDHADFGAFGGIGLHAVGAELSGDPRPEAELMGKMEEFVKRANLHGLKTHVHGLGSISLTTAAVCAGFDHVDGDAVTSVIDMPEGIHRFRPDDIFSRLVAPAP